MYKYNYYSEYITFVECNPSCYRSRAIMTNTGPTQTKLNRVGQPQICMLSRLKIALERGPFKYSAGH